MCLHCTLNSSSCTGAVNSAIGVPMLFFLAIESLMMFSLENAFFQLFTTVTFYLEKVQRQNPKSYLYK